jgi:hypothetical protein
MTGRDVVTITQLSLNDPLGASAFRWTAMECRAAFGVFRRAQLARRRRRFAVIVIVI